MATNNSVNTGLAGATGTGSFVGSTSPSLTTPNVGVATATSLVFSPTTNGIIGTTTNDNAAAGMVGEYISSSVLVGSAVALTSGGSPSDITSISLTAGDWEVNGLVATNGAGGTLTTRLFGAINTTSATLPTIGSEVNLVKQAVATTVANEASILNVGATRLSLASTTTVYLIAQATFTVGTLAAFGFIGARRVR